MQPSGVVDMETVRTAVQVMRLFGQTDILVRPEVLSGGIDMRK